MGHTPSVPLSVERGDWDAESQEIRLCINCGERLPENQQEFFQDYYECGNCGWSSPEFTNY